MIPVTMNYNKIFYCITILINLGFNLHAQNFTFKVESGVLKTGTATVYLRENHNNSIIKPFILIEGFDPIGNMSASEIYNQFDYQRLFEEMGIRGYDIIVFNIDNPHRGIMENAELVKRLIKDVNNMMASSVSINRTVVAGISMGGLIAKAALCELEKEGYDHRCGYFMKTLNS